MPLHPERLAVHPNPEGDSGEVGKQLHGIGRQHRVLHAVELDVHTAAMRVVGYFKHRIASDNAVILIRRGVVGVAVERIVRYQAGFAVSMGWVVLIVSSAKSETLPARSKAATSNVYKVSGFQTCN
jgi:hypothetical protein